MEHVVVVLRGGDHWRVDVHGVGTPRGLEEAVRRRRVGGGHLMEIVHVGRCVGWCKVLSFVLGTRDSWVGTLAWLLQVFDFGDLRWFAVPTTTSTTFKLGYWFGTRTIAVSQGLDGQTAVQVIFCASIFRIVAWL